jgi:predicted ATP-dependent endonuclease of OLD family
LGQVCTLSEKTTNSLRKVALDWQKPASLDAVAREIFFSDGVVFVEGQEDVGLLRKFAGRNNIDLPELFGYGVGGAANIRLFLQMANELGVRCAAIYDGDQPEHYEAAKREFPNCLIEELPTAD